MIVILGIIGLALIIGVYVVVHKTSYGDMGYTLSFGTPVSFFVISLYFLVICIPVISISGGLMPEYSKGYREGCIYKISETGAIFKTIECEMQLGGQMLPMATPFYFSICKDDTNLITRVNELVRKNIRVYYKEYLITDWRISISGYVVTKIEEIK